MSENGTVAILFEVFKFFCHFTDFSQFPGSSVFPQVRLGRVPRFSARPDKPAFVFRLL